MSLYGIYLYVSMVNGKYGRSVYSVFFSTMVTMVDGCEIVHQLIDGKHPIVLYGCQPSVVQDIATIHSMVDIL